MSERYILSHEINRLSLEDLKLAYFELMELDKTGILDRGIVRDIINKVRVQNPSIGITVVRIAVYEKLLYEYIGK